VKNHSALFAEEWKALNEHSDECVVALFLSGKQDALTVLFDRYSRLVFSIAVRIVKDASEAEDVVQTVFLDCIQAMANFNSEKGTFKVWLLQYAYHRALHRKRHLEANRFYSWVGLESVNSASPAPLASEVIERAQLLYSLLEKTTAQRRMILELTYCEGLTANEVSIRLGLPANVVRHELYRALAELRKLIAQECVATKVRGTSPFMQQQGTNAQTI